MKEAIYYTCENLKTGGTYVIGQKKLDNEPGWWAIIAVQRLGVDPQPVPVAAPVNPLPPVDVDLDAKRAEIEAKIAEFTKTDIDISFKPVGEFEYFELLAEVKRMGIEVSGNPKRDVLEQLYTEATG